MVFCPPKITQIFGAIAQLGEHLLCKQGVRGSIPRSSTMLDKSMLDFYQSCSYLTYVERRTLTVLVTCSFTNWKAK
jgi:hypothetical protein